MGPKTYIVTLGRVYNNGIVCESPEVRVLGFNNLIKSCVDSVNNVYEVVSPGGDHQCITFSLKCCDCDDCGTQIVTKCLCETSTDCNGCEACRDGLCESLCPEGYFCEADECVNCNADHPCTGGRVCVNSRCQCPPDAPIYRDGICLECEFEGQQNCKLCIGGKLVDPPCPGTCDPATNECVDCLTFADCPGENECCRGRTCACCEGFGRDREGNCVPMPDCLYEDDCGPCQRCNGGKCEPQPCPEGYTCVGEHGCVPSCDCGAGEARCEDAGQTCASIGGQCGCIDCTGNATEGCSRGCRWNGYECVADACAEGRCPCTSGIDCPPGYGCDGFNCRPCDQPGMTPGGCAALLGCDFNGLYCGPSTDPCHNLSCEECSSDPNCACTSAAEPGTSMGVVLRRCRTKTPSTDDCSVNLRTISRSCAGLSCTAYPGAVYRVNGVVINDICNYLATQPNTTPLTVTAQLGQCASQQITLPALQCGSGFSADINRVNDTQAIITVTGDSDPQVTTPSAGVNVVPAGPGKVLLTNLVAEQSYDITTQKSDASATVNSTIPASKVVPVSCGLDSDLITYIESENCGLRGVTNSSTCACDAAQLTITVDSVTSDTQRHTIAYTTELTGKQVKAGDLTVQDGEGNSQPFQLNHSGEIVLLRPEQERLLGSISLTLSANGGTITVESSSALSEIRDITVSAPLSGSKIITGGNGSVSFAGLSQFEFTEITFFVQFNGGYESVRFTRIIDNREPNTVNTIEIINTPAPPAASSTLTFNVFNLVTMDGCTYSDTSHSLTVRETSVEGINPFGETLAAVTPTTMEKNFVWVNDGVVVRDVYAATEDTLPASSIDAGEVYELNVICASCEETTTATACCDSGVTTAISGNSVIVTVVPMTGVYEVYLNGGVREVDTTTTFSNVAVGTYLGWVQPKGVENCRHYFVVNKTS